MKQLGITALAALAVIATSCSNENDFLTTDNPQNRERTVVLSATMSDKSDTRATLDIENNKAVFKWATGDQISVFSTAKTDNNEVFTLAEADNGKTTGSFTGTLEEGENIGTLAYYPYNENHNATTFILPDSYGNTSTAYVENTHAAYRATISEGSATFKPLAGLLCVRSKVPAGVNTFVLTATGMKISGTFDVTEGTESEYVINAVADEDDSDNDNTVTYQFTASNVARDMDFYIPLPVGTYTGLTAELKIDDTVQGNETKSYSSSVTINKGRLVILGELSNADYDNVDYTTTTDDDGKITYTVYTAAGFQKVRDIIQAQLQSGNTFNVKSGADIDMTSADLKYNENTDNFSPMGNSFISLVSSFDGCGHSITGLKMTGTSHVGIIRYLGADCAVKNTTLIDCNISGTEGYVSGFAAQSYGGIIENCHIIGKTTGEGAIIKSTDTATDGTCIGGIVGFSTEGGKVINCSVTGKVTIEGYKMVGAIVGYNHKNPSCLIESCSVSGDVTVKAYTLAGGITGISYGDIKGCTVNGNLSVIAQQTDGTRVAANVDVGGIAGASNEGTISDCKVIATAGKTISIEGGRAVAGIAGSTSTSNSNSASIIDCEVDGCTIESVEHCAGGITAYNKVKLYGCSVKNTTIQGKFNVGGIAGESWQYSPLTSCFVTNVTVIMTADNNNGLQTVGGIVGANGGGDPGKLYGCYAYDCEIYKNKTTPITTPAANILGSNCYPYDGTTNPREYSIVEGCYFYDSSKPSGSELVLVTANATANITVAESGVSWDTAKTAMKTAVENAGFSPIYTWGGTYDAPTLTNTTPAPSEP